MPFKCLFRTCRGNYLGGPKVSVFSFPKDKDLAKKWLAAIPRDFKPTKNSKVCELHFKSSDIITTASFHDCKTGKTVTARLSAPRLAPGAVPSPIPRTAEERLRLAPRIQQPSKHQAKKKIINFKNMSHRGFRHAYSRKHSLGHKEFQLALSSIRNEGKSVLENERIKTPLSKAPEILYINSSCKNKNEISNTELPSPEPASVKKSQIALSPGQDQISQMTVLCGPFPTIEAAASLLYGSNTGTSRIEGDDEFLHSALKNNVVKVEPYSPEENSNSFEMEPTSVDNLSINHVNGSRHDLEVLDEHMHVNSEEGSKKTEESMDESSESDDLYFFRSLIPDLKNISRAKKSYIRLKIQELIYKEVYNCNKS